MDNRIPNFSIINLWSISGAGIFAIVLLVLFFLLVVVTRPKQTYIAPATAVLYIIPASTATLVQITLTPQGEQTQRPDLPSPLTNANISVGIMVQINGTEGDGLRLRSQPGLNGDIQFFAYEAEVFIVDDGPIEASGYIWWFLVAPYDESVRGWAVSNYLKVIP